MEEDYKRILDRHRDKFRQAVSIERLSSPLLVSHILSDADWQTIENEVGSQRVDRLLDLLKTKGYDKFKRFCVILETTYPYMLNCMFLGMEPPRNMFSGIFVYITNIAGICVGCYTVASQNFILFLYAFQGINYRLFVLTFNEIYACSLSFDH